MAEVYWIHLPEHSDVFTQGYVGVTRNTAEFRFKQHKQEAERRKEYERWTLTRAINKYGDRLQVSTLLISDENYCYEVEFKLRPDSRIGWNMAPGGQRPIRDESKYGAEWRDKLRQCNLGKSHSEETLKLLSDISKSRWEDEEFVSRMKEIIKERRVSKESTPRFWKFREVPLIEISDKILNVFDEDDSLTSPEILNILSLEDNNRNRVGVIKILRRYLGGWDARKDPYWLRDFKNIPVTGIYVYEDVWDNRSAKAWSKAVEIKALLEEGKTPNSIFDTLDLKSVRNTASVVVKYIRLGWNPEEDYRWLNFMEQRCQKT